MSVRPAGYAVGMGRKKERREGWTVMLAGKAPARRMSDTLIDFAKPELIRPDGSPEEWHYELRLASTVWNGVLVGMTAAQMLAELTLDPKYVPIFEVLARRRATKYRADRRCVLELDAYVEAGDFHVVAKSAAR